MGGFSLASSRKFFVKLWNWAPAFAVKDSYFTLSSSEWIASHATVGMMFPMPAINEAIKPKSLFSLIPGARKTKPFIFLGFFFRKT